MAWNGNACRSVCVFAAAPALLPDLSHSVLVLRAGLERDARRPVRLLLSPAVRRHHGRRSARGYRRDIIAEQTIAAWTTGQFRSDTTLARLGAAFSEALRSLPVLPGDDARHDVLVLLQAMRLDATRIATKNVLTRAEIKDQLRCTFHHSLNILLIGAGLRTRAAEVPDLMESLGWCSVVRDLAEDLARGLVERAVGCRRAGPCRRRRSHRATSGGSALVGGGKDRGATAPREVADRARRDRGRGAERGPATRHVSALH